MGRDRPFHAVLLAGCGVPYVGASAVWYVGTLRFGVQLAFPSPVDAVFFASYAVFTAFLVKRSPAERHGTRER